MEGSRGHLLLAFAIVFLADHLHCPVILVEAKSNGHIVYMGEKQHEDPAIVRKSHYTMLSTLLGSKEKARSSMLYTYKHGFSGFAAMLTESQAKEIAGFPGVVSVMPNRIHKLRTTRSWDFLGVNTQSANGILRKSNMGKGVIVGVIDSGFWPESEMFSDKAMGPIPSRWKGICQQGERFNSSNCNRKIIGARWFLKGIIEASNNTFNITGNGEILSARDVGGHGTHTASTIAGNYVEKANYKGLGTGLARGGAPLAHLAIYKACWNFNDYQGCTDADTLKAIDTAIHDGVDLLSMSIGNEIPLLSYVDQANNPVAIAAFHATAKGITVVCAGGNEGPYAQTVENTEPWLVTVAATTIDRSFPTAITLGNNRTLLGQSMDTFKHISDFTGLVYSSDIAINEDAQECLPGSLNETLAAGKIVFCFPRLSKQNMTAAIISVIMAGGSGLIYTKYPDNLLVPCILIPCIRVEYEVGTQILTYTRQEKSSMAKLSLPETVVGKWASPRVAHFSSRGPSSMSPAVLKPDIAAPGVNILAAVPPARDGEKPGMGFESGTSMACPHVSGIVALIKSAHPEWSPAALRSALVTTASQTATDGTPITEVGSSSKVADPFDIGGGNVNPNKAMDPGLIYNISSDDYLQFLCSMGYGSQSVSRMTSNKFSCMSKGNSELNLNLPSITIPNLKKPTTVPRTVTNIGQVDAVYKAIGQAPKGIKMIVQPQILHFNSTNPTLTYKVTFSSTQKVHGDYHFGSLTWTDNKHFVRIPISVRSILFESYAEA